MVRRLPADPETMRSAVMPCRHCLTLILAALSLWVASPAGVAEAQQYSLTGEALALGNPGTDQAKARAAVQETLAKLADWEVAGAAGEYDKVGTKDPRWDDAAREGLTQYARYLADAPRLNRLSDAPPPREGAKAALGRALAAGCQDPLAVYSALALGVGPAAGASPTDLPRLSAAAEKGLGKSTYPPGWKFRASLRAAELAGRSAVATAAATGRPPVPPPGTDFVGSLDRARGHLVALARDPATPRDAVAQAMADFLRAARAVPDAAGDRACAELGKALDAPDWTQAARESAAMSTAAGLFWVGYAWRGCDDFYDGMIPDARWKPFQDRLARAQGALENAWRLDPANARAAVGMLAVERGQHQSRERLETWFRRALDADPDSFEACVEKLNYLRPQWFGDAAQMVEFGHQCQATRNWTARLPFILVEAHRRLAAADKGGAGSYWRRENVWNDVRTVYGDCLAANPPTAQYERSGFALWACTAGQWKVADGLFKELAGRPNLRAMGGIPTAKYKQLVGQATYLAAMKPGQADALTAKDEATSGNPGATVEGE